MMEEKAMFRIRKQKALYQEKATYEQNLIEELEKLYELNANFGASKDSAYLEGNTELEISINKILELKNTQVRVTGSVRRGENFNLQPNSHCF